MLCLDDSSALEIELWEERPTVWVAALATHCTSASTKRWGSEVSIPELGINEGIIPEFVPPMEEVSERDAEPVLELGIAVGSHRCRSRSHDEQN